MTPRIPTLPVDIFNIGLSTHDSPRITALASIGLMAIMLGAVYSHLAANDGLGAATPAMVLFVLLGIVAFARRNALASLVAAISGHPENFGYPKTGTGDFFVKKMP